MNANRGKRWGAAALLGCVALLGVGIAQSDAKVRFRDSFEKDDQSRKAMVGAQEATPHGKGWRAESSQDGEPEPFQGVLIDLEKAGAHPPGGMPTGSLSLWIQRNDKTEGEGILSFVDRKFNALANVSIHWDRWPGSDDDPILNVSSRHHPLWYRPVKDVDGSTGRAPVFPVSANIARGQWFNLTFTWGPSAAQNSILIDGKRLAVVPEDDFAMRRLIQDTDYLLVGAGMHWDQGLEGGESLPKVVAPMRSMVDAVEILDTIKTDFSPIFLDPDALTVAAVEHDAFKKTGFSGKLVAGNKLDVTVRGTAGKTGSFDVAYFPDMDGKIAVDWRGWGVYLEEKTFYEPGEVNLRDVEGYRVFVSKDRIDVAAPAPAPVAELDVQEQSYTVELLEVDTPYYVAVLAEMRDGTLRPVIASPMSQPLAETAPGVYAGSWEVTYQDRYPRAVIVGSITDGATTAALAGDRTTTFATDPALTIGVAAEPNELRADEKSVSKISVSVTDANGNPVAGHKIKFLLATTSQYTGVVGGGAFADQVGGSLRESSWGETDLFGKLTATYVAGFAAKTAVIVARDMASNSTGAGYVKTYIQTAAELELEPAAPTMAAAQGYEIAVTSSDEWLTADGKSQARITARVTLGRNPVEGHAVTFSVSAGTGSIRTVSGTTDRNGEARAVYTAGKKIGIVLVTATDVTVGISGSVQIELRSDAPAKITIKIDPEKLPADGRSTADLLVLVTDINDNPNDNAEVEYRIASGDGSLRSDKGLTDRNGESRNGYVAGRSPGRVSIEITVRSTVPTEEELTKARNLALAVSDSRFF